MSEEQMEMFDERQEREEEEGLYYILRLDVSIDGLADATVNIRGPQQFCRVNVLADRLVERMESEGITLGELIPKASDGSRGKGVEVDWGGHLPHHYRSREELKADGAQVEQIISVRDDSDLERLEVLAWTLEIYSDLDEVLLTDSSVKRATRAAA